MSFELGYGDIAFFLPKKFLISKTSPFCHCEFRTRTVARWYPKG